jgi:hypothetical protein
MNLVNKINQIHQSFNKFKSHCGLTQLTNVKFDFIWVILESKIRKKHYRFTQLINVKFDFIWVKDKDISF